jgi:hypothetical protein
MVQETGILVLALRDGIYLPRFVQLVSRVFHAMMFYASLLVHARNKKKLVTHRWPIQ